MFKSAQVPNWVVLVYERQHRFRQEAVRQVVTELVKACEAVGKAIQPSSTVIGRTKSCRSHNQSPARIHEMGIWSRKY